MKKRDRREKQETDKKKSSKSTEMKRKKNVKRLGGGGLSLEAFANLKSTNSRYNPALIRKQREFNKNAKYVSKFKRSLKQQNQQKGLPSNQRVHEMMNQETTDDMVDEVENDDNEMSDSRNAGDKQNRKLKKKNTLEELYRKKHEEEEKARMEREAIAQAKKEEREKSEARRKAAKEKMLKKTRHGQPVMKYRIENLLESIQNSAGKSGNRTT